MRFIAIAPLWLGLMSSCLAAPSQIINFQDNMGQYSFNYNEPFSSRSESRSADGMTRGIYSYVDANGNLQTSEYEAGTDLGFNVKATNLPQAPLPIQETPEILAARQKHLQLLEEANRLEESERALQGINQSLLKTPATLSGGEIQKSNEIPQALFKFREQTGIKEGLPKELNQPLENKPIENLRSKVPTPGAQIISDVHVRKFVFPEFENSQIIDFPDGHARDAGFLPLPKGSSGSIPLTKGNDNMLPLPKGDGNFNPFPQGNINSLHLPKSDANPRPLLKGDANLNPFLRGNGDFVSLPRIDANSLPLLKGNANINSFLKENVNFNPFLKAHTDLLSLPKIDASSLPLPNSLPLPKDQPNFPSDLKGNANLPKTNANLLPLPKSDVPTSTPAILPQRISGEAPEQRIAASLPEQVKDTAEVAAARDAHLRTVAEAASKSAVPVKDTPEVMAAREAHLRMAAQPGAVMPVEFPMYTPEVQAAREAHFRAYQLAAKLAAESDVNPRILEQLLGRPGEPKLGPQRIESLGPMLFMDRSAVEFNPMRLPNPAMKIELPMTRTDAPMESSTLPPDNRGIENLAEKPQLKEALKSPQTNLRLGTGITPASTRLRIPDSRLTSPDEFEQSKVKADLICGTALKVKDLNDIKPTEDQRLMIIKSGDPAPFVSTVPLPIDQSERWKNWGFQYMSL